MKMPEEQKNQDVRIVVLQRGFVAVGRFTQDGEQCRLEDAAIIRRWGTTKGLGQIAADGPTSNTILDKSPALRFHALTVITTIDCEAGKWNAHL
ncbi:MAG TPA: hypothetical protein DCZ63_08635 [Geobacter sp.]|nr:hypothetical protein [Geobacter sp.]